MRFLRPANAGGLIELDGVRILLDGVCGFVAPYLQTPAEWREYLMKKVPDAVGFTHLHPDHFDSDYLAFYASQSGGTILSRDKRQAVGKTKAIPIPTRHLGKNESGLLHSSFLISGSMKILFAGDAAPGELTKNESCKDVDVLIAPYAFAYGPGLRAAADTGAKHLIVVHMPAHNPDEYGIWKAVEQTVAQKPDIRLHIPSMGEIVEIL